MGTKHLELDYSRIILGAGDGLRSPFMQETFQPQEALPLSQHTRLYVVCVGIALTHRLEATHTGGCTGIIGRHPSG